MSFISVKESFFEAKPHLLDFFFLFLIQTAESFRIKMDFMTFQKKKRLKKGEEQDYIKYRFIVPLS